MEMETQDVALPATRSLHVKLIERGLSLGGRGAALLANCVRSGGARLSDDSD